MDIEILLWLQGLREAAGPTVEAIANFITEIPLSPLTYALPFLLFWCFDKRAGRFVMISFGLSTSLLNIVKVFACVPRPWIRDSRLAPSEEALGAATGYAFPSGHVQTAGSVYGAAGWYYRAYRWPLIVGVALTVFVAFTRCFVSVHTPQDVLAGLLIAVVCIWAAERLMEYLEREGSDARIVLGIALAAIAVMIAITAIKPYPEVEGVDSAKMIQDAYKAYGVSAGIALGLFLERRYVAFSTDCPVREKVLRVVISLALAALFYLACQLIKGVGFAEVYGFSRSFFCSMAAIWAGPAIAQRIAQKIFVTAAN